MDLVKHVRGAADSVWRFLRAHWIGTVLILVATLIFFWPIVIRLDSYSEGGDAMFNAWTLSRDHHCILREDCANYADANIYFPHKDTMLYSETQLSAGLLTLPIYLLNNNPLVPYNIWMIASAFFGGWFMYLLAKYLSRGTRHTELVSVLAGLIFEFAPFRMPAWAHLQNLSIFYLPIIVLFILKYIDTRKKRYLVFLFTASVLLFYASWYQMVFTLAVVAVLLLGYMVFKLTDWRTIAILAGTVFIALLTTLPLAKEYVRFSKSNQASFAIGEQAYFSSSLSDYVIPHSETPLGKIYYWLRPNAQHNSYNPDSHSYHGMVMYGVATTVLAGSFVLWRKKRTKANAYEFKRAAIFAAIGVVGFIISLGPLLKIWREYTYATMSNGIALAIPMPYILVDKFLPQLMFVRALGRASVILLFVLCCMLAILPRILPKIMADDKRRRIAYAAVVGLILFELFPLHQLGMTHRTTAYNLSVPAAFKFIKERDDINNIVILRADDDYPEAPFTVATPEYMMWAGYANKNIFNGYSGYNPPTYKRDMADFTDFQADDLPKLRKNQLHYVMVDKQLSTSHPELLDDVANLLPQKVYEDTRYTLFKVPD